MNYILLTQNSTPVIGQIAWLLGKIMNGIFFCIDKIGIPNVGVAIILFTIVIYLLMMPLTIKQQKFSKLSAKMNPELQAIQAKYKNKKDNESMQAMQMETQAVYAKYGVSPSGSCVQLLIQMPILFALYRVIYSMPAYVTKIGNTFRVLADKIISVDNGDFIANSDVTSIQTTVSTYGKTLANGEAATNGTLSNVIIDVLNKLSSSDLASVAEHYDLTNLTYDGQLILSNETTKGLIDTYNNFLGLNIGDSPSALIRSAWATGSVAIIVGAILIPVLSMVTQWINIKLMPQQATNSDNPQANSMAQSMKTMNMLMPIMSAWFCFTLPAGMGIYWIAGSVIRSIQQIVINKHIDKMDFDEIIKKNSVKSQKKLKKLEERQKLMNEYATKSTKNLQSKASVSSSASSKAEKNDSSNVSSTYTTNAKPGSMLAKANMVKDFNEKNNKKN